MAEIIRGGIISVDSGQMEGALSIGMTYRQVDVQCNFPSSDTKRNALHWK